jgi:endoribonuclease Dicer
MRSAVVNNFTFAYLAVMHKFHDRIKISKGEPRLILQKYVKKLECTEFTFEPFDLESHKIISDVFESFAGAIYVDSGGSLEAVWNVYKKILIPFMKEKIFVENCPKNPKRIILETYPNCKIRFEFECSQ